jgi:hypothetical protein
MLSSKHQAVSDAQNSGYEDEDPWMAPISKWAAGITSPFDTSTAIISAALRDKDKINPADAKRVADCLRRLGFEQDKQPRWIDGRKSRFWLGVGGTDGTDPSFASVPSVPTLSALGSGYDAEADGDDPHWRPRP